GKHVAVIGTGASAVQFVPEIAKTAARVTIYQRTAPYVLPRPDGPIRGWMQKLHQLLPFLPRIRRNVIFNLFELRHAMFRGKPWAVNGAMKMWRKEMEKSITDPAMQQALTPPYRIGCKRVLSSNDWYPALARPNVTLLQTGLQSVSYKTLTGTDGSETDVDVVIWGTGFHVTDSLASIDIAGEGGLTLKEAWSDGLQAHLGTATAGFPNLFFLLGPHTGLGHNSVVLMIEAQVAHVCRLLDQMREAKTQAVAPKPEAQAAFEAELDERLSDSVWQAGGCVSWYQDENGRNTTLWPGTVREFQRRMAKAGIEEYRPVPVEQT
ncbi:MAG: flavin-containing monooxygenase, partial [Paracoccaceae bacterium]